MESLQYVLLTAFVGVISAGQSNIVLFITDDQDVVLGGLNPLEKTLKNVADEGASVINAFTSTPICCPSRASILTGLYQKHHQVLNNSVEGGCSSLEWQRGSEQSTFAVALKQANYTTFYAGKYMNQYGRKSVGGPKHVPPGWDSWVGLVGNSRYYNYTLSINGTARKYGNNYLTNTLNTFAEEFLDYQQPHQPFLMVLAPPAPHSPFTPEPKYDGKFRDKRVPRDPYFNSANNSDKHWLVRMKPAPLPNETVKLLDSYYGQRWETLLSVDDMVNSIVQKLSKLGVLDNTYIIFTSDNGFHLGQFSMPWDKRQPYEFDVRVPFLIKGPGLPKKSVSSQPILLIDIYPTLLGIAGVNAEATDGQSILPLAPTGNRTFYLEYKGESSKRSDPSCPWRDDHLALCSVQACCKCQDSSNNTYACVRSIVDHVEDFLYCRFEDDEAWVEAYDMIKDPYQLVNLYPILKQDQVKRFTVLLDSWKTN